MGNGRSRGNSAAANGAGYGNILRVSLLHPPQDPPVSLNLIKKGIAAICTVCDHQDGALNCTGFLVRVAVEGHTMEGFITHCSTPDVLTARDVELAIRPVTEDHEIKISIDISKLYTFYCPLTEIVFVKFEAGTIEQIKANGCDFINASEPIDKVPDGDSIYLWNSTEKNLVSVSCGVVKEYYGLDIRHDAACNDFFVTGLPVFSKTGQLIGIQKSVPSPVCINNLAVSMATLVDTHFKCILTSPELLAKPLVTNPIQISSQYEEKLKEIGLEKLDIPRPKYAKCLFYVSPPEKYITPIWFMPTQLGWYWTPTDPNDGETDSNWMPVKVLAVVGGSWNGQIPAAKNVKIIRWLVENQK